MPRLKVAFFLSSNGLGWEEVYYRNYTAPGYTDAKPFVQALLQARRNLSPQAVSFDYVRMSDDAIRGDSAIDVDFGTGKGRFAVGSTTVDHVAPAFTALLCRLESGTLYRRSLELRGLPGTFVRDTYSRAAILAQEGGPEWIGFLDSFAALLSSDAANWNIKAQTKAPGNPELHVLAPVVVDVPNQTYTLKTSEPVNPLINGTLVRVLRMRPFPGLSGTLRVVGVGANSVTVQVHETPVAVGGKIRGIVQQEVFGDFRISRLVARRWSHRDTGRPFPQGHGHR